MDRWLEFIGNHPFLFGIMGVLIVLFFAIENKRSGKKVSPSALGMLVNSQNAQLIDIRAKKKYETGYIQGSRNIPFTELKDRLDEIRAIENPIVIICDMGVQAGASSGDDRQRQRLSSRRRHRRLAVCWHAIGRR